MPAQIGALVMTESGQIVMDQYSEVAFNPASVAKIVTAFGAIKTLGLDHRFTTTVSMQGDLDQKTGVLRGDVYIQSSDPDFDRMDAQSVAQALREAGLKRINGKLIVSKGFSFCSMADEGWSARQVKRTWANGQNRLVTGKDVAIGQPPESAQQLCQLQSEPFRQTLKEMLSYSQNNVAEQIGRSAGGIQKLESSVEQQSGLAPGSLQLVTASGLGRNRVKPKDMMLVLKAFRAELQRDGLDFQDLLPVAGVDGGTLDERFVADTERGSVVGKTGSLPGTDGGTSALVGMLRSQKEDLYFVFFCWRGDVVSFRHQQDQLIRQLQATRGGPKPFAYNLQMDPSKTSGARAHGLDMAEWLRYKALK